MNIAKNQKIFTLIGVCVVLAIVLGGCGSVPRTPIEGENTLATQLGGRVSFNMDGGNRTASEARSGNALEIGYQHTTVNSAQTLSGGQPPVIFNGITFPSPNQLKNGFDFTYQDISWRQRMFLGNPFGLEIFSGIGQSFLGLDVASPAQHTYRSFDSTGLNIGFGLIWRTSPSSSIHARGTYFITVGSGISDITKYELYYANALFKNLSLRLGYTDWTVNGSGESGDSDFNLHFAGPTLVLDWCFNLGD